MPALDEFRRALRPVDVHPLPHDRIDGFLGTYWRRPDAYLEPGVRSANSTFAKIPNIDADLADGMWARRDGHLLYQTAFDLGYRLVIAYLSRSGTT